MKSIKYAVALILLLGSMFPSSVALHGVLPSEQSYIEIQVSDLGSSSSDSSQFSSVEQAESSDAEDDPLGKTLDKISDLLPIMISIVALSMSVLLFRNDRAIKSAEAHPNFEVIRFRLVTNTNRAPSLTNINIIKKKLGLRFKRKVKRIYSIMNTAQLTLSNIKVSKKNPNHMIEIIIEDISKISVQQCLVLFIQLNIHHSIFTFYPNKKNSFVRVSKSYRRVDKSTQKVETTIRVSLAYSQTSQSDFNLAFSSWKNGDFEADISIGILAVNYAGIRSINITDIMKCRMTNSGVYFAEKKQFVGRS